MIQLNAKKILDNKNTLQDLQEKHLKLQDDLKATLESHNECMNHKINELKTYIESTFASKAEVNEVLDELTDVITNATTPQTQKTDHQIEQINNDMIEVKKNIDYLLNDVNAIHVNMQRSTENTFMRQASDINSRDISKPTIPKIVLKKTK